MIIVDEQLFIEMLADYIATSEPFDYNNYLKERTVAVENGTEKEFDAKMQQEHINYVTAYITEMVNMKIITEDFSKRLITQCKEWA